MSWTPSLDRVSGPRYLAIARAIEADVVAGRLVAGDRLPPHRDLADALGVNVGTVSRAYAEARKAGWIRGEVGRGTFVLDRLGTGFPRVAESERGLVDLSLNIPVEQPAPDLRAALRQLAETEGVDSLLNYGPPEGLAADREAGAAVLRRHGLDVEPESVVLCGGAQHGLGVALEAVTRPGDRVLAESLTYPAFRGIAESRGLEVRPVEIDDEGLLPAALDAECRRARPTALYTIPTLHNPTTATLSEGRRRELADVARRYEMVVIEDDVHRMLAPDAPPPIASFAPEQTIYIASLAKTLAPGLRVGYLAAPAHLRSRVAESVWRSLWMLSPVVTGLATQWIRGGELDAIAAAKRREAAARQILAAQILPPDHVHAAPTAYHLWLTLGPGQGAAGFAWAARMRGVVVTPAPAFHLGSGRPPDAVRVSLSAARDRAQLGRALETLRDLLDDPDPAPVPRL